ncbi:hypothetical protein EDB81DRAFT_765822 [Dactylonectria macrodidyma]|uniref:Uncharacterized protein n=1 Tax=Dactylonectria macrodidyma TaxID=307937 RepID=A0A9P9DPS1_9HYPO|nr:hypothetical protein EDB81DRAFT_765822 [Dactylonectria macrodidyma]
MGDFEDSLLANWYNALLLIPGIPETNAMGLWGNVKIPFLSQEQGGESSSGDWTDVTWSPDLGSYSVIVGTAVTNVSVGNTTLSLESSSLDLDCAMTVIQA